MDKKTKKSWMSSIYYSANSSPKTVKSDQFVIHYIMHNSILNEIMLIFVHKEATNEQLWSAYNTNKILTRIRINNSDSTYNEMNHSANEHPCPNANLFACSENYRHEYLV